jgi:hypothetical protein
MLGAQAALLSNLMGARRPGDPYGTEDLYRSEEPHKVDGSARTIPIPRLLGIPLHPAPLYLAASDATAVRGAAEARLTVSLHRHNTAGLLRLDVVPPA